METNLAATQPEQPTAAPVTAESAPVEQVAPSPVAEKEPEWFVKRIGEMTAKWRTDERRAMEAERERDFLRGQLQQNQQPKSTPEPVEVKTLADFGYDESKFQHYVLDQAEKRAEAAARRVRSEEQDRNNVERRVRKFKEREVSFEKETPDYRDVAHYAPVSDGVAELIQELDSGPALAYHLGKNKDIALFLNDLPLHVAAVELGRIDAKLSAEKQAKQAALEAAKAAKAVSQAPPPAPQIDGVSHSVDKDPAKMSDKEYAAWRKKQIAARRIS